MLLYCPKCKTGYAVEPELIPENGKKMRCAKCGEIWFCTRDDLVEPQPEPPVNKAEGTDVPAETAVSAVENDIKMEELPAAETASLENVVSPAEENLQTDNTSADSVKTPAENEAEKVSELPGAGQTPVPEKPAAAEEEAAVLEDNKVVVEFTGESWVELKDRKKVYFQGVFHRGDKKEIDYADNLFLSVGRPHNVKVYVKGMEKNILAKKRKMNIPLDSLD